MTRHGNHDQHPAKAPMPSKRARLEALLFTAASIGTTLLTLGLLGEVKLPRAQAE